MSPHRKVRKFMVFVQPKCPQCAPMLALIEKAALPLGIHVEIVDCTADQRTAAKYKILSAPTALLLKGGEVVRSRSGKMSARELEAWLVETNGG